MQLEFCCKDFSYQSTFAPGVKKSICLFSFTSWTGYQHKNNLELKFIGLVCWHTNCYIWITLMFFCRCFLKSIMHSMWCFLEQFLRKKLFGDFQDCVRWPVFKQLKHKFFSFAKFNRSAGPKDLYLLLLKNLCWLSHRMHLLLVNVVPTYFSSMSWFFCNSCFIGRHYSLNAIVLSYSQFTNSASVGSFVLLKVKQNSSHLSWNFGGNWQITCRSISELNKSNA